MEKTTQTIHYLINWIRQKQHCTFNFNDYGWMRAMFLGNCSAAWNEPSFKLDNIKIDQAN